MLSYVTCTRKKIISEGGLALEFEVVDVTFGTYSVFRCVATYVTLTHTQYPYTLHPFTCFMIIRTICTYRVYI